ncbi:hypothetical protein CTAYLR_009322 [Chrysophaeum taylorii]|uniref:Bifunctional lysine-specific demethylase and histidyl-hydroxylase n=1 Tax=Chrysophaeum taylorii TaxID=2483200 RepID=A0AAD7XNT0_9STRA|nr:hypothetical protein CTAYLR_009322 [Chrysophaeum taylorii]
MESLSESFLLASRSAPPYDEGWRAAAYCVDLDEESHEGTIIINGAAETVPEVGAVARAAIRAFAVPCSINCYHTGPRSIGAPPHSDVQEIIALQCAGSQRWRVWRPEVFEEVGKAVAFEPRGPPALDVTLSVGEALYVPFAWPHATETDASPSLHATLGLDLVAFGFDHFPLGTLRDVESCAKLVGRDRARQLVRHNREVLAAQTALYTVESTETKAAGARDWARRYRRYAAETSRAVADFRGTPAVPDAAIDLYVQTKLEARGFS